MIQGLNRLEKYNQKEKKKQNLDNPSSCFHRPDCLLLASGTFFLGGIGLLLRFFRHSLNLYNLYVFHVHLAHALLEGVLYMGDIRRLDA